MEPTKDEEFISGMNAVQTIQELILYYQLCLNAGRSPLMWCLISIQ
jgi:hypothetical protein